ncbi:protein shuttle craft [Cylas formicarius]|uniref:protein shuttle craft n=1 Tax=Cylas formicarius TaxID=197179 RepID=UPI002958A0BB|nr:protein shuttle craft [Cylas formicarius]
MSHPNNLEKYLGTNGACRNGSPQHSSENFQGPSTSLEFRTENCTTLQPTAQEFYPSSYNKSKTQANRWNGRNQKYGSGRIPSSNDYYIENSKINNYPSENVTNLAQNVLQPTTSGFAETSGTKKFKKYKAESHFKSKYYNKNYTRSRSDTASGFNSKRDFESDTNNYNGYKGYGQSGYKYKNSSGHFEEQNNLFQENTGSLSSSSSNVLYYNHKPKSKGPGSWKNKERTGSGKMYITLAEKTERKFNTAGQRERLIEMVNRRTLECLVCCEKIKHADKVWSCLQCFNIIHLNCISAWAKSSQIQDSWRCPACQNIFSEAPSIYKCYCGKMSDPKCDPNIIAHGCGEICLRKGRNCDHKCTLLCHPGPCPDCTVMVSKPCGCGVTQQVVKCSGDLDIICDAICNKVLDCGIHCCIKKCHSGSCSPCPQYIIQECYCGKTGRKVSCTAEVSGQTNFSCENACEKDLPCGNHKCQNQCHPGDCGSCDKDVTKIKTCFCGKMPLTEKRMTCLDPIPFCNKVCGKTLPCGQPSSPHVCKELCHEGKCPPCLLTTVVRCRCGHMDKEVACQKLTTKADDARCERKCNKKRLCGKHKCNQRCCIELEHICPLPCNHLLSCGLHRCDRTCHSGRCPPCLETSFEELYCECGASVVYPPVPCGTKPPVCSKPCSRPRACGHPPNHECHTGPCPPCFVLSTRWCFGKHEKRAAIPCHQENFSCGLPCGKPMSCGFHKCIKPCHNGDCPLPCSQPCSVPRLQCGHPCNRPCHNPPCPDSNCKQLVSLTCQCGLQKGSKPCLDLSEEFRNIEMAQIKERISRLSVGQTVDMSDIVNKPKVQSVLKILDCNEECRILERNRRLAIGLQIRNPDLTQKLTPRYSDFMKQWAKKDQHFCQKVHDKLTELVQLAKQSKQKSRSYSFESMNRDKRHFIHEYCEHFGIESAAYDKEPNRNVVATAIKDKSWLPSLSLLEAIQRENGHRRVPGPMLGSGLSSKSETVSLKVVTRKKPPVTENVDYFYQ